MGTPNLGIQHVVAAQNQPEVTVNAGFDEFDGAITDLFSQAMADADQTPSTANAMTHMVFECTGALTADRHLILPNTKKLYVINNKTTGGHNIIVETAAPAGTVSVAAGSPKIMYCDGANNFVAIT